MTASWSKCPETDDVKRIAILFIMEMLFGTSRRQPNWPLLLTWAGVAMVFWLLLALR
jgi:hypothetical protein